MLVNYEEAKIKLQIKDFQRTGVMPDAVYAGHPSVYNDFYFQNLFAIEADQNFKYVLDNLQTGNSLFKLPYTLSKYKKGINPVCALYEELQRAMFTESRNKFDLWIIDFCNVHHEIILNSIKNDIKSIESYIVKYKKADTKYLLFLDKILKKFKNYVSVLQVQLY